MLVTDGRTDGRTTVATARLALRRAAYPIVLVKRDFLHVLRPAQ